MIKLETIDDYIEAGLVHSIHTSERRSARGCRRRWNWISREGYYPLVTAKPLEFGVAFHIAMEKLYDPLTWNDKQVAYNLAKAAFVQKCEEQFQAFKKAVDKGLITQMVDMDAARADYEERKQLGLGMLYHYANYEMPAHDNFTPVKVEIEFEVAIKGPGQQPLWCKCRRCWDKFKRAIRAQAEGIFENAVGAQVNLNADRSLDKHGDVYWHHWRGLPATYGGRLDALVKDSLGRLWIVDWKTASKLSTGEPGADDDHLWLDDQITSYCWALWSLGLPIAGFIYAEIKKAFPQEPEPLKRPYKGCMYSTNRQQDTTYDLYKKTVEENDPSGYFNGAYDEFLEYLKEKKNAFHLRHQIHRNESELINAGHNIWLEACELTDPNLRIYPSPGRFACSSCAFQSPCLSMNRDEDYQYTLDTMFEKRDRHYYEREPSTDSKGGQ